MSIALSLHVLAVVIWVGGMFLAYLAVRPTVAEVLEPPARLTVWVGIFNRFFPWVWGSVVVLLVTGYWMIFSPFGGMKNTPVLVHIMQLLGLIMMAIFAHVYFAPFKRLKAAVDAKNWAEGGTQLGQIRRMVGINLILGFVTIVVGAGGKFWI